MEPQLSTEEQGKERSKEEGETVEEQKRKGEKLSPINEVLNERQETRKVIMMKLSVHLTLSC